MLTTQQLCMGLAMVAIATSVGLLSSFTYHSSCSHSLNQDVGHTVADQPKRTGLHTRQHLAHPEMPRLRSVANIGSATTQGSSSASATTTTPSASASSASKNTTSTSTAVAAVTAAAAPPQQQQCRPPPAPPPFAPCRCPPPAAAAVAAAFAKIAPPRLDADSVPLPKRFTRAWQRGGVGQTTGDQTAFVFFHQRKCGGTSWRQLIDEASDRLVTIGALRNKKREVYISGFHGARRDAYTLDKLQVQDRGFIAIAAGHLQWGITSELFRITKTRSKNYQRKSMLPLPGPNPYPTTSGDVSSMRELYCFTQLRNPLERLLSCVAFRFGKSPVFQFGQLHKVEPAELRHLLPSMLDGYGQGCLNEPSRILSGVYDEQRVNFLGYERQEDGSLSPGDRFVVETTKEHMAKCVVGVIEDMAATYDVVSHYLSWILEKDGKQTKPTIKARSAGDRTAKALESLRKAPEQLAVVKELLAAEQEVYDFGVQLHKRQLAAAKASRHGSSGSGSSGSGSSSSGSDSSSSSSGSASSSDSSSSDSSSSTASSGSTSSSATSSSSTSSSSSGSSSKH